MLDRSQFVNYGGKSSSRKITTRDVPHGSVLGPTLFLVYINDLPDCTNYFSFRLFADDSNLFHTFPTGQFTVDMDEVNIHLKKVSHCCNANKLTINLSKTNYMIMSGSRKVIQVKGLLKMSNTTLNEVAVASFVGLNIDKHILKTPY